MSDEFEITYDMIVDELKDVRIANQKLGDALREIYAIHGEDQEISRICNDNFKWMEI